jgi:hypothetical protein
MFPTSRGLAPAAVLAGAIFHGACRDDADDFRPTPLAELKPVASQPLPASERERLAKGDLLLCSAIGFGAVVGGHREEAWRLRAGIEADATASLFVRSALHLKLVAALGDRAGLEAALAERASPALVLSAAAVVEGGGYAGDSEVMLIGVRAPWTPTRASLSRMKR